MKHRRNRGWLYEPAPVILTIVTIAGMVRLFDDTTFLRDGLTLAVASHLVAVTARRGGLAAMASTVVSIVVGAFVFTVLLYSDTTAYLVFPTLETITAVRADLSEAWTTFHDKAAPVPVLPGFVSIVGVVAWVLAFVADRAAHRTGSAFGAVLPAFSVFFFTALLGTGVGSIGHAALFSAAAAAVILTMRTARQAGPAWIEAKPGQGTRAVLGVGACTLAFAVVVGAGAGPSLPGAGADPVVDLTELDDGPQRRIAISPLVQVKANLVEQSEIELFSVSVPRGAQQYWRLMALDEFDGNAWRARFRFLDADGPLPSGFHPSVIAQPLTQEVTIAALGTIFLPAAHEVQEVIDDGGVAMEYEPSSGSLIRTRTDTHRFTYTVRSSVPRIEAAGIEAPSTGGIDAEFLAFNTDLPSGLPASIRTEADKITAGASNDYERALALQKYFQDQSRFTYDLEVALDHDVNDLESFLFDVRAGYCEQFSSAFAAMARSVGLPTRVAVGFTGGEWDSDRSTYIVRGKNAHSWPEVYFVGTGWVRFEPTPGRDEPDLEGADVADGQESSRLETDPPVTTITTPSGSGPADIESAIPEPPTAPNGRSSVGGGSFPWLITAYIWIGAAMAAGAVSGFGRLQRRRHRSRLGRDPIGRIEMAWADAVKALGLVDIVHHPHQTPMELAARVSNRTTMSSIGTLARCTTQGRYCPDVPETVAAEAEASAWVIARACRQHSNWRRRIRAAFDPR